MTFMMDFFSHIHFAHIYILKWWLGTNGNALSAGKVHESTIRKSQWINKNEKIHCKCSFGFISFWYVVFSHYNFFFRSSQIKMHNKFFNRFHSRKFESLILLNIHAKCEHKKSVFFFLSEYPQQISSKTYE